MKKNKEKTKMVNWMRFKKLYLAFSAGLLIISAISLGFYGLKIGLEFRGGVEITYKTQANLDQFEDANIQTFGQDKYIFKFEQVSQERREEILEILKSEDENSEELNYQLVGPEVGKELIRKTIYAILISAGSILLWVAFQFKSAKFGLAAILAMIHDSFILIGSFSLLGHFYGAETDFLFITAVLTTLTFSVHDTIVVFDRIREISKTSSIDDIDELANKSVTETMRRSVINSLTIIFMLTSLVVLGGDSIKWFATALLIGAIAGTYSSPFVAVPLYTIFAKFRRNVL